MAARFTVLASGSSGNAALVETDGFGLLIDCGLHPRMFSARLAEVGSSWDRVNAVILTHTHGDHWKDLMLADMRSRRIPLYAHPDQHDFLATAAPSYEALDRAHLTRAYQEDHPHELAPGLVVHPIRVSHDSDPTFAFRVEGHDALSAGGASGPAWSVGYASDLGTWTTELVELFTGVDVLAVEFNHDLKLERASSRPRFLVDRVLSDNGHLSNDQAAEFTAAVASRSGDGFPSHLVQLHLSKDCNRPELASATGRAALAALNLKTEVITARQDVAAKSIPLMRRGDASRRPAARSPVTITKPAARRSVGQPSLPGFEG